ncbi:hypothetical protein [Jannaschia sp. W003]|uniref:hypothetical protein n=1 Tax=Jannaschia sp. W003 TaxID=2867012 RepID=UPI0021A62BCA|nr:hypothetical protein [Jannaschia sp. W003]UWQ22630.1 hypothetical protein K3554_06290 [Jannaschia sp. W003]
MGNAPLEGDVSREVDRADRVVRFNKTRGFGGATGCRIDDLFLVNCGGQMREWLHDPAFWRSRPVAAARRISLPVAAVRAGSGLLAARGASPCARDGVNYEHDARARLRGRPVRTMPDVLRRRAIRDLAALGPSGDAAFWPSTGLLGLYWYDAVTDGDVRFALYGFGFTGWGGHAWDRERAWVARRARAGRIRLHDPAPLERAKAG